MKKTLYALLYAFTAIIFSLLFLNACQKNARLTSDQQLDLNGKLSSSSVSALVIVPTCTGIKDSMPAVNHDNDSIERPTILVL